MTTKPTERVIPPRWKYTTDIDFTYRPTRWERFKIAIGMNVDFRVAIQSEHSAGKMHAEPMHKVVNKL